MDGHGKDENDGQHLSSGPGQLIRTDVRRLETLIPVRHRIGLGLQIGSLADQFCGKLRIRGGSGEFHQQRGLLGEVGFAQHVDMSDVEFPTDS